MDKHSRIRILGIAPYDGLKSLMEKTALEFPDIELTAMSGDLQEGVTKARSNFHADYDVIISRGGTARLLREQVDIPVIEIQLAEYDILRAIHLAENISDRFAMVGFPNITMAFQNLSEMVKAAPRIFTVDRADDVDPTMDEVYRLGYRIVLCDVAANTSAKHHGLNAVLITSSQGAIRKAFVDACTLCQNVRRLRAENHFFREIINRQSSETLIFDEQQNLIFSNLRTEQSAELLNILKQEMKTLEKDKTVRIVKYISGGIYSIKAQRLLSMEREYAVFFITRSRAPLSGSRQGIRYFTEQEARQEFSSSIFVNASDVLGREVDFLRLADSRQPVVLLGEEGSGRESAANLLYFRSNHCNHPFVCIRCQLLTPKSREFLASSHNSPFADSDLTIYFSGMENLPVEVFEQMMALLKDMDVAARNKLLFSATIHAGAVSRQAIQIMDRLGCLRLNLLPLRELREHIPALVNLFLSQLSISEAVDVAGIESGALEMLKNFDWPGNFAQLKRVMRELVSRSNETITSAETARILSMESREVLADVSPAAEQEPMRLDRTLDEINRDIVRRVLKECKQNQTLTAKRLGISRTTVWKLMKQ